MERVDPTDLAARQALELRSWIDARAQREPLTYLVNTLADAPTLLALLGRYERLFERATDVLELGAGQGWASCIVKRRFPHVRVTATDMSPKAISGIRTWERVFDVDVDVARSALSYDTGQPDASIDLVFAFASAHHFVLHKRTFQEIFRILRPGGQALYLFEPSCRDYVYPLATRRIRRTRTDVVEDMLKQEQISARAHAAGLACAIDLYPTLARRGPLGTIYNAVLIGVPILRRVLWCTANFQFTKPAGKVDPATS